MKFLLLLNYHLPFIIIVGLFFPHNAGSQQKSAYIQFGSGWGYNTVLDQALSPDKYSGNEISAKIGYSVFKEKNINILQVDFNYGKVRSSNEVFSTFAYLFSGDINYRLYYPVTEFLNDEFKLYLGVGFLNHGLYREYINFTNNNQQYDYSSSLSFESYILKDIMIKDRKLTFSWQFSLPVLSVSVRPSFNTSLPEGFIGNRDKPVKAVLESMKFNSFHNYLRVVSGVGFGYQLLNRNEIQLYYNWDLYQFFKINKLSIASHELIFILAFNISKP